MTRALVLASVLMVAALASGDAPAASSVLRVCTATVQQSSPQALATSTECNFPVNWYEFALTDHNIIPPLQDVPPGWQVNYQQNGNHSLAFVFNSSGATQPFAPFNLTVLFGPPLTGFPLDHMQILAADDMGGTPIDVPINTFVARGDMKKSYVGKFTKFKGEGTGNAKTDGEVDAANGIEIIFTPDESVSQCDQIATIQVVTIVDDKGNPKKRSDLNPKERVGNWAAKDAAASGGHTVDAADDETTPYYQESSKGHLDNGTLGSSDGKGKGTPADVSDAPTGGFLKTHPGWKLLFEDWAVCIKGENVGEVLGGLTWELAGDPPTAKIDNDDPDKPSDGFKDAVKSWEAKNPGFKEPGGGFKW